MKSNLFLSLVALVTLGSVDIAQAQSAPSADEQALVALEMQWVKADKLNNGDMAAPLMADRYTAVSPSGKLEDKAQTLADFKVRKYSSAEVEGDIKVTLFGDTAIVRGAYIGAGTESGKPFHEHLRWTDTWMKVDGKWVCVATHYSAV